MSITPDPPSPAEEPADRGAASLVGISIRPSRRSDAEAPQRKRGDITLLLSRVSGKPLPLPNAAGRPPIAVVDPQRQAPETEPRSDAPAVRDDGPIDATMREFGEPVSQQPADDDAPVRAEPDADPEPAAAEEFRKPGDRRRYDRLGRRISDIQGYWTRLRDGRRWPAWQDFDAALVAQIWPNSYLLSCDSAPDGHGRQVPSIAQATRVGRGTPVPGSAEDVPITHAVVDWIRSVGAEVAASGLPARETDSFDTARGPMALTLYAVPLSDDQDRVDRVLCHVARAR